MTSEAQRLSMARLAVHRACAVCRAQQAKLADLGQLRKDDRSPVTVADFAAQAVVAHTLREGLGAFTLIAEESATVLREQLTSGNDELTDEILQAAQLVWEDANVDDVLDAIDLGNADSPPPSGGGFWTLDPIDGTKGFLRHGQYAVSLAWIVDGAPQVGILGCPNMSADFNRPFDDPDPHGTIYIAIAGEGLHELPADDPDAPMTRVWRLERSENEPLALCESVDAAHTSHDWAERAIERLGEVAPPRRLDGQGKYAVVARGQADVYLRLPRGDGYIERIWDHAAGALIATEAGCAASDVYGRSLDFGLGRGMEANRGVVVATPDLHGQVLAALEHVASGETESKTAPS